MEALVAIRKCNRETNFEFLRERESLENLITSSEIGMFINQNVSSIINNRKKVTEEIKSGKPNNKVISRANENVQTCVAVIKTRMARLGATQDEIATVVNELNNANYQRVTLTVLKVMARKNPGMHQRKYEQALRMIANKNNQKQY